MVPGPDCSGCLSAHRRTCRQGNPRRRLQGQSSVSSAAAHTPDACWPGADWTAVPNPVKREAPLVARRTLAPAEYRIFTSAGLPQPVWFWHLFDGRPITFADPDNIVERFGLAWRNGFRRDGDQLFVRVSATGPGPRLPANRLSSIASPGSGPWAFVADQSLPMPFNTTRRERIALSVIGLLLVLGLLGFAIL